MKLLGCLSFTRLFMKLQGIAHARLLFWMDIHAHTDRRSGRRPFLNVATKDADIHATAHSIGTNNFLSPESESAAFERK